MSGCLWIKSIIVDLLANDERNLLPQLTHRFSKKAQNLNNNKNFRNRARARQSG